MGREVPFDVDEKCDICGKVGAYDFMGDYICDECLDKHRAVASSCGCVFCDLEDEPEVIDGKPMHVIDDDINGNAGQIPCTKGGQ